LKLTIVNDNFFYKLTDGLLAKIRDAAPGIEITIADLRTATAADLNDPEIVYGRVPVHALGELHNLKWIHLGSSGSNGLNDISLYPDPDIILTKSSGTFGIPIAEHIIGMMLTLGRNFYHCFDKQREGTWSPVWSDYHEIYDSVVLVLGLGDIGTEVCRRLSGFGCRIIGFRKDHTVPHKLVSDVRPLSRLRESLPEADYIVLCLPGTAKTDKLIGHKEFALMKSNAMVINVGRGMVIDTDALIEALDTKKIAGAGLDVTEPEPLPAGHPLWTAPNVFITPHVSAGSQRTEERRVDIFVDLLKRYIAGEEMYNRVNFDEGY